ncbi:GroES-like protein [Mytilinidion resinicola]|uniref:GroES-like protein n=1 Tax=Mytilinidion resinicola TaxID=574789 RepID=A0A6A6Z516_9PEZI|nr:GroES-like protein [Mytilinidion resinicola]KAF2815753.1 GroES-like protein [Mytilinidion resinicola]
MAEQNIAALLPAPSTPLSLTAVPTPAPEKGEVLIKNYCIAIQPLDAKILHAGYTGAGNLQSFPAVLGTSLAGVVEAVGEGVEGFKAGDRVVADTGAYSGVPEKNLRQGCWQKYVIAGAKSVAKIGDASFEQAVLVDFPLQTAVAALHNFLGMGKPGTGSADEKVLIWGAGGAVGSYAVQYAKSVGHTVIVTASARDTDRQKSLGASAVLDYKSPDIVEQLRPHGPFRYLFTGSGDPASQKALAALLQPAGGSFASVLGGDVELPENVTRVYLPFSQVSQKEEHAVFRDWWYGDYLPKVLTEGLVQPVKFEKREGGLGALWGATKEVFEGKIRGKVVLNPQD